MGSWIIIFREIFYRFYLVDINTCDEEVTLEHMYILGHKMWLLRAVI